MNFEEQYEYYMGNLPPKMYIRERSVFYSYRKTKDEKFLKVAMNNYLKDILNVAKDFYEKNNCGNYSQYIISDAICFFEEYFKTIYSDCFASLDLALKYVKNQLTISLDEFNQSTKISKDTQPLNKECDYSPVEYSREKSKLNEDALGLVKVYFNRNKNNYARYLQGFYGFDGVAKMSFNSICTQSKKTSREAERMLYKEAIKLREFLMCFHYKFIDGDLVALLNSKNTYMCCDSKYSKYHISSFPLRSVDRISKDLGLSKTEVYEKIYDDRNGFIVPKNEHKYKKIKDIDSVFYNYYYGLNNYPKKQIFEIALEYGIKVNDVTVRIDRYDELLKQREIEKYYDVIIDIFKFCFNVRTNINISPTSIIKIIGNDKSYINNLIDSYLFVKNRKMSSIKIYEFRKKFSPIYNDFVGNGSDRLSLEELSKKYEISQDALSYIIDNLQMDNLLMHR